MKVAPYSLINGFLYEMVLDVLQLQLFPQIFKILDPLDNVYHGLESFGSMNYVFFPFATSLDYLEVNSLHAFRKIAYV